MTGQIQNLLGKIQNNLAHFQITLTCIKNSFVIQLHTLWTET